MERENNRIKKRTENGKLTTIANPVNIAGSNGNDDLYLDDDLMERRKKER